MLRRIKLVACRGLRLLQGEGLRRLILAKSAGKNLAADDVPGLISPYYRPAIVQSELCTGKILVVYLVFLLNPDLRVVRSSARDSLIQDRKRVRSLAVEFVSGRRDELPVITGSRPVACNTLRQSDRMFCRIKLVAGRSLRLLQGESLRRLILSKSDSQCFTADDVPCLISPYFSLAIVQSKLCTGKILFVYLVLLFNPDLSIVRGSARDSLIQDGKRVRSLAVKFVGCPCDVLSLCAFAFPAAGSNLGQLYLSPGRIQLIACRCLRLPQRKGLLCGISRKSGSKVLAVDDISCLIVAYCIRAIVQGELCAGKGVVVYCVFLRNRELRIGRFAVVRDPLVRDGDRAGDRIAIELVGCPCDVLPLCAFAFPSAGNNLGQLYLSPGRIQLIACRCLRLLQRKGLLCRISRKTGSQVLAVDDAPCLIVAYCIRAIVKGELCAGKGVVVYRIFLRNRELCIGCIAVVRDPLVRDGDRAGDRIAIELVGCPCDVLPLCAFAFPSAGNNLGQLYLSPGRIQLIACRCLRLLQRKGLLCRISRKTGSQVLAVDDAPCLIVAYCIRAVVQGELCAGKRVVVYRIFLRNRELCISCAAILRVGRVIETCTRKRIGHFLGIRIIASVILHRINLCLIRICRYCYLNIDHGRCAGISVSSCCLNQLVLIGACLVVSRRSEGDIAAVFAGYCLFIYFRSIQVLELESKGFICGYRLSVHLLRHGDLSAGRFEL